MALIDYKIVKFSHEGRHVSITVRVYRGSMQDSIELVSGVPQTVNRYVRIAILAQRNYEYDVPRDMTRGEFIVKARALLNQRLLTFAQANGHTVITEQQDVTEFEPVNNEVTT